MKSQQRNGNYKKEPDGISRTGKYNSLKWKTSLNKLQSVNLKTWKEALESIHTDAKRRWGGDWGEKKEQDFRELEGKSKQFNIHVTRVPKRGERGREGWGEKGNIWENNGRNFSKFDEKYQPIDPRLSDIQAKRTE